MSGVHCSGPKLIVDTCFHASSCTGHNNTKQSPWPTLWGEESIPYKACLKQGFCMVAKKYHFWQENSWDQGFFDLLRLRHCLKPMYMRYTSIRGSRGLVLWTKMWGRDIVDTCFHASRFLCHNMTKQRPLPTTWGEKPNIHTKSDWISNTLKMAWPSMVCTWKAKGRKRLFSQSTC
jgi:hypothetical protein